jgi:DNA-directed RNA polymerase specialized sigma24 family protein
MSQVEEKLVLRAQAGERQAFDRLLRRYEVPLFHHILRLLGDEDATYTVLQDTYLAIIKNIRSLRSRRHFRAWAFGVATRKCFKSISRRQRRREVRLFAVNELADPGPTPVNLVALKLPPRLLSVILLHFFEDLTLREVAAALEISIGTAKSRLAAGLARLRTQLEEV